MDTNTTPHDAQLVTLDVPAVPIHVPPFGWRNAVALSRPLNAVGIALSRAQYAVEIRRARPALAMVAVPLAMNATMPLLLWWLWPPLLLACWWWADRRTFQWTWLVGMQNGLIGTQWCIVGAYGLADYPEQRPLLALGWITLATCILVSALLYRRDCGSLPDYPGY